MDEPADVEGPTPEDVMRYYFERRVEAIKRERARQLLGLNSLQAVDYIKSGRNDIKGRHLTAVTGERTARDLFRVLSVLSEQAERGEITVTRDVAVEAGKRKQRASSRSAPDQRARGGAAKRGPPSKRSPGGPRPQSAEPDPSDSDR